jgi:hypothetical protein
MEIKLITVIKMLSWLVLYLVAVCKGNNVTILGYNIRQLTILSNSSRSGLLIFISSLRNKKCVYETWSRAHVGRYHVLCYQFEFL